MPQTISDLTKFPYKKLDEYLRVTLLSNNYFKNVYFIKVFVCGNYNKRQNNFAQYVPKSNLFVSLQ